MVKPLAFYPLALLLIIILIDILRKRKIALPSNSAPLFAFLLFAIFASLIGALFNSIELRGIVYSERVVRAWISVLIGLAFFFAAFWMNRTKEDLRRSLKWLYISLALTLAWSFVQAIALNTSLIPRSFVNDIQLLFSERGVQPRRITGFAYEPSWLADQILLFYMPWLYAAILNARTLTSKKWLEPLLFVLAFAVLLFTYSRSGLFGAALTITLVSLIVARKFIAAQITWFANPFRRPIQKEGRAYALPIRFAILLIILITILGSASFLAEYDYFANLWQARGEQSITYYLAEISVAQRLAYAFAGYEVFEQYPLTGVGFGR